MRSLKKFMLLGFTLMIGLVLMACGSGGGESGEQQNDTEGTTSQGADSLVARGEEVVANNCLGCHSLEGNSYGGPLTGLNYSEDELLDIVTNGRGNMPAGIAKGEEEAVVQYLLSIN